MTQNTPYQIAIVDDHPMLRHGIAQLLELEDDLDLVTSLSSASDAIKALPGQNLDLILMDLNLPGTNGIRTIERLRQADVTATILVFTVSDDHADVFRAIASGADGYLLKDMEPEQLLDKIRQSLNGNPAVSDSLSEAFAAAQVERVPENVHPRLRDLTEREQDVLRLIAKGFSNKHIAEELSIAEGTVKVHVKRLLSKLGLNSRVEAAVFALEQGFE